MWFLLIIVIIVIYLISAKMALKKEDSVVEKTFLKLEKLNFNVDKVLGDYDVNKVEIHGGSKENREKFYGVSRLQEIIKYKFYIDYSNQQIAIEDIESSELKIINICDVLECEILEDNSTIFKGGVGRAVVGGLIAGGIGAIVGANTRKTSNIVSSIHIRIITNNINNPMILVPLLNSDINRSSYEYKAIFELMQELYSTIISFTKINNDTKSNKNVIDNIEERILRLQQLKDKKLITQDEFNEKKKDIIKDL